MGEVEGDGGAVGGTDVEATDLFLELAGLGGGFALGAWAEKVLEDGGELGGVGALEGEDADVGLDVLGGLIDGLDHLADLLDDGVAGDDEEAAVTG